ncbi:MAG: hypothetical protein GEU90_19215 [Gemmatimonas sp.]|nr:hypothetical protein [Gemmatimonas sp.]
MLSGAASVIGVEFRDGVRIGGIEDGRLVEVEERNGVVGRLVGRWGAGGGERWRSVGKSDLTEDPGESEGVVEKGEDPHLGAAVGAAQWQDLVDPSEPLRPAGAAGALRRGQGPTEAGGAASVGSRARL